MALAPPLWCDLEDRPGVRLLNGQHTEQELEVQATRIQIIFPERVSSVPQEMDAFVPFDHKLASDPRIRLSCAYRESLRCTLLFLRLKAHLEDYRRAPSLQIHHLVDPPLSFTLFPLQEGHGRNIRPAASGALGGTAC